MAPGDTAIPNSVAVIGAGLAGLAAARELHVAGRAVTVFDKGRGVGGRLSVRRSAGHAFDHGAQYFTVRSQRFGEQVEAWRAAGDVAEWTGRIVACEAGTWRDSAAKTRYVGVPGMNQLAKSLAASVDISCQMRVTQLVATSGGWRLLAEGDVELGSFAGVVVALPAPQAAELLPVETPLREAVAACGMTPCWAVLLGFDEPVPADFAGAFVNGGPLAWIARNNAKPGRGPAESWVLHATPEWSAARVEAAPADVTAALRTAFSELLAGVPEPTHSDAHRWRYAQPPAPLEAGCLVDLPRRLVVCGDWCEGARVEGAYLSGVAAADVAVSWT